MINEIKQIVENYISNRKLSCLMVGSVTSSYDVKVSEKLTIPNELIFGNIKKSMAIGNKVRLLRDDGGATFYILEVIS
jgi:hypothetical protein